MQRTAERALDVLRALLGTREQPDGSNNAPPITTWYYNWAGAWCAMTVSYALAHGGWSDDGGETLSMPGIVTTTAKGWSWVEYVASAFRDVGRYDQTPRPGDLMIYGDYDHTGMCESVNPDGSIIALEGNFSNRLARVTRTTWSGCCHPAYDTDQEDELTDDQAKMIQAIYVQVMDPQFGVGKALDGLNQRLIAIEDKLGELAPK